MRDASKVAVWLRTEGGESSPFDVWIDHDEVWPPDDDPEPVGTFEARSAEQAADMAAASGEFDREFTRGGTVKLLVRKRGSPDIVSVTMEPVVEYRIIQTDPITLAELRGA